METPRVKAVRLGGLLSDRSSKLARKSAFSPRMRFLQAHVGMRTGQVTWYTPTS